MIYERYIGAFILNTIKPLIEELDRLLGKCEHLHITGKDAKELIEAFVNLEIRKTLIWAWVYLCGFILLLIGLYFLLGFSPTHTP